MYENDKVIRRYSESFKLKILDELTTGKLNIDGYSNIIIFIILYSFFYSRTIFTY